jgi:parvulin-like peptidyl-prolyl isomerase
MRAWTTTIVAAGPAALAAGLLAALLAAGCDGNGPAWPGTQSPPAGTPVSLARTGERPDPPPAPATAPAPLPAPLPAGAPAPRAGDPSREVIASVNGRGIYMDELTDLLMAGYGMPLAQQLIANELVRQESAKQKIALTEADVQAEIDTTMATMFAQVKDANQRQPLLNDMLRQNNVSRRQWDLTMRRNAALAKLAEKRVTVDANDLKDEFAWQYGQKRQVRHIQTANLAEAQKVLRELGGGADFKALVNKYSISPAAGDDPGLLPAFAESAPGMPPAVRQAAFALKKIGDVSDPIQVGTGFHLVKLEAVIDPVDVKFDNVKDKLRVMVHQRRVRAIQQDILRLLLASADVQFVHPILKAQAENGARP